MHEITRNEGRLVTVRATGKLTHEDYDQLIPAGKRVIEEEGSMRMLLGDGGFSRPGAGRRPGMIFDSPPATLPR